jgi:hypothetical protein
MCSGTFGYGVDKQVSAGATRQALAQKEEEGRAFGR